MSYQNNWADQEQIVTVREVVYDPLEAPTMTDIVMPRQRRRWPLALLVFFGFVLVAGIVGGILFVAMPGPTVYVVVENDDPVQPVSGLSPIFTPEVQFWADDIIQWATAYGLDPNLIATVIQIESCGDPTAGSPAGAQGLFQVMPFHFTAGESMLDVQTNARRGLNYLSQGLVLADGHAGLALAGYNGGHGVINLGWAAWASETQRYFYWGAGIYFDAANGKTSSERLDEWLGAGGNVLCRQARATQQTLSSGERTT